MGKKLAIVGIVLFVTAWIIVLMSFTVNWRINKNKNNLTSMSFSEKLQKSHDKDYMTKHNSPKSSEISSLLCRNKWDKPHDNVVLTSGASFSYSLYATTLASKLGAPILLTEKDSLDSYTKQEMIRLKPKKVIIVGDSTDISKDVEDEIKEMSISIIHSMGQYVVPTDILNNISTNPNAKTALRTPTYDGKDQACHPKVVYFPNTWNGWKYWMAMTPYPNSDDYFENPSILVSNSGTTWEVPKGLANPVAQGTYKYGIHNSDPHLIYNDKNNEMELWYRSTIVNKQDTIYRMTTKDGIHWTTAKALFSYYNSNLCLSPSVLYEEGKYKMWYINEKNQCVYMESQDGMNWSNQQIVNLNMPEAYLPWHIDVEHTDRGYEAVYCGMKNTSNDYTVLFSNSSSDGINFNDSIGIVKPSSNQNAWDNKYIYRSAFVKIDGVYKLYYSAMDKNRKWHIGLSMGDDLTNLRGYEGDGK